MKNFKAMLLTSFVAIFIISCSSSDDDGNDIEAGDGSYLIIDGISYELEDGVITHYAAYSNEETHFFEISLFDTEIYDTGVGEFKIYDFEDSIISGIYFELWSNDSDDVSTGTYTYENTNDYSAFTYTYGEIAINFDTENESEENFEAIISGDVIISENGDTYEISFEGTTEEGKEVSAYYKGRLIKQER